MLPNVKTCAFIFREAESFVAVLDPGVAWKLGPVSELWNYRDRYEEQVREYIVRDRVKNVNLWSDRLSSPEITLNYILDRKLKGCGQDWFG
jgi:hypothetical protein